MSAETVKIVWMDKGDSASVNTLTWADGSPRIYARDRYDSRLDLGLTTADKPIPYFRHGFAALGWMLENPGKPCQVDTRTKID